MRRILRFGLVVGAAATVAAACGEGRAIFNVDLYSFFLAGRDDTLHYTVPPGLSDTVTSDTLELTLLGGLQDSGVDSLRFTGTVAYENNTGGPGTIGFLVFFDTVKANVFSGTPAISVSGQAGPGNATTAVPFTVDVTGPLKDMFVQPTLFVGVRAIVTNPGAAVLDGRVRVTAFDMRLIVQERVF
ncbi:MAG TPA: hypothetical protein VNI61_05820 [Gemmatimonadales bacterium]|nr:hypothetical protein [Gemmatimonadales bacterium]